MRNYGLLLLCLIIAGCAQVVTPSGGPKDVAAPVPVAYFPDSAATNFNGKKIVIRFNEYVQLNDLNSQLVVSPTMNTPPEVSIRKKELVIVLKDTLKPNTTYNISFGSAVRDITEGNTMSNFRYVFSTGATIDSLSVRGSVVNAFTVAPVKSVLVLMYTNTGDSVPAKEKPFYFAKTDEAGNFLITNVRAGKYKIFVLEDLNQNYLYDKSEEKIAFREEALDVQGNVDSLRFRMFKSAPQEQARIKVSQLAPGRFSFQYALPITNPRLVILPDPQQQIYTEYSRFNDSLQLWLPKVHTDTATFMIYSGNVLVDSLRLPLRKPEEKKRSIRQGEADLRKLELNTPTLKSGMMTTDRQFVVGSNNPIVSINAEKIVVSRGKDTLTVQQTPDSTKRYITFATPMLEDSTYRITLFPGAFTDCFGQKNDTMIVRFKVARNSTFGTMNVKIQNAPASNGFIQVIDERDAVIESVKYVGQSSITFNRLTTGGVRLRFVADENNNGKWDSGIYWIGKQPERVYIYPTVLRIKAGWDLDVEWKFVP